MFRPSKKYPSRDTVPLTATALKIDISGCRGDMKQAEIQSYAFIYRFSYT
jgi:hypothetical protein